MKCLSAGIALLLCGVLLINGGAYAQSNSNTSQSQTSKPQQNNNSGGY